MSLRFHLTASVNIWKQDGRPSRDEVLAACRDGVVRWGGTVESGDSESIEASFPWARWQQPVGGPFSGVRRALVTVRERDLSVEISVDGQSTLWVSLGALVISLTTGRGVGWRAYVLAPLVSLAIVVWYYGGAWYSMLDGLKQVRAGLVKSIGSAPNKRLEPTRRMIRE